MTIAYFGGLLLSALLLSTLPLSSTPYTAIFFGFILIGVALFFLPLMSVHAKMQAERQRLQREIGDRYSRLTRDPSLPQANATLDGVRIALARLADLRELELLDRKVASLPTWPFDIQVVSRLIIIVLSVTAALAARLVADLLHI